MIYIEFFTVAFLLSLLSTFAAIKFAVKFKIYDRPNERSSHAVITPRVGGIAIVITFLFCVMMANFFFGYEHKSYIVFFTSAFLIAIIGFWDDLKNISSKLRLLFHFIAAINAIYWLGGGPPVNLYGYLIESSVLVTLLSIILLVWFLNLFNFMDGIDGIAASETIFVCLSGAFISWVNGSDILAYIALSLVFSTLGFLVFNWPPAKIFMGDVGSGFLGITIGILAYANAIEGVSLWVWFILFSVFLVDSTYTLIIRFITGEKWYVAHCSHAYQHAARQFNHKMVTLSVSVINIFWLFPLAYLSYEFPDGGIIFFLIASLPLLLIAKKFNAGLN